MWSTAIAICDFHRIQFVKGNAVRQSIIEANSVLIIVIVSTVIVSRVGACGQLSNQLELELFVDCMVSGTAPAVIVVVVDFLLNSGFYKLRLNLKVKVIFGNIQQEGIVGMIGIARFKVGNINDQIITCLLNGDGDHIAGTWNGDSPVYSIRVEIVAYKARKSDAVIIGIMPFADNRNSFLSSEISFKLTADGRICRQLRQKLVRLSDVAAPLNVGNLRGIINITLEDLESFERVVGSDLLSVVCKRRDRHGADHGNCQQCGQQLFDCFLHHDLRKSPFKFF